MAKLKKNLQLLSTKEIAELLGVHVRTIRRMRYQGGFPKAIRIGCQWRWRVDDIEKWLLTKQQGTAQNKAVEKKQC